LIGRCAAIFSPRDDAGLTRLVRAADAAGYGSPTAGTATFPASTQTIAVVDAYNDPTAEADLAVYDKQYGLPACTVANGCFRKLNEEGKASPLPSTEGGGVGSPVGLGAFATPTSPALEAAPSISGSDKQGQTLSASDGEWSNSPTAFKPQWTICNTSGSGCTAISGASASSYVLPSSAVGKTIRLQVTASNASGSSSPAFSTPKPQASPTCRARS
jgi:hypothetical protein